MNIGDTVFYVRLTEAVKGGCAIEKARVVGFDSRSAALWTGGQLAGAFVFKEHDEIFETEAKAELVGKSGRTRI